MKVSRRAVPPLPPFEILQEVSTGRRIPLPRSLSRVYGPLRIPRRVDRPYVLGNFATTLDGVASLGQPGESSGGDITGFDPRDRFLMGLLRAVADVVVVGAGTVRASPRHIWTAEHIYPPDAATFRELRRTLGKPAAPLVVVVSSSGRLDPRSPLLARGEVPVLIVTTPLGARRLTAVARAPSVEVRSVRRAGTLGARDILGATRQRGRAPLVLVEGGPHLLGTFLAGGRLDELFLTLAPQLAGRRGPGRLGLVEGQTFAPSHPRWGRLAGVRRGGELLYLRYVFGSRGPSPTTKAASSAVHARRTP